MIQKNKYCASTKLGATHRNTAVSQCKAYEGHPVDDVRAKDLYCTPSFLYCSPNSTNSVYSEINTKAERVEYQPRRQCRPSKQILSKRNTALVVHACRFIEHSDDTTPLSVLASSVGLSPFYFHRTFKQITGVTPKEYEAQRRVMRVREAITSSPSITDAIYAAGFNSRGRFYDHAVELLGMTPRTYRNGGAGETIRFAVTKSTLGPVLIAATDRGICMIQAGPTSEELLVILSKLFPKAKLVVKDAAFDRHVANVVAAAEELGASLDVKLPSDVRDTAFQHKIRSKFTSSTQAAMSANSATATSRGDI